MSPQIWQKGPNLLPAFPGSWYEGNSPSFDQYTVEQHSPNLSWRRLSRPPAFCRPSPGARPIPSIYGSNKGARAATQAWLTVTRRHPWRQACGGTQGFSQYWRDHMWSRPNWSTEDAEAMRPSILWNALRGWGTHDQCMFWRENRPHSGWVNNCSKERDLLTGGQRTLGKIDPES